MPVTKPLRQSEFVALIAALFAIVAISIDAMLPALPQIAASLSPDAPNRAQLVVTSFVFGMGLGTLFMGPLADRFGRKPVIIAGILGYMLAALACYFATSLSVLLVARMVMGIAASAPRTVSTALVRDLFKGRAMAQVMSFVMMVFTLVPAVAPWMGQQVIYLAGWHAIYLAYMLIALATMLWVAFRQPETLAPQNRRSLALGSLWTATKELLGHRIVVLSILCQALTLGSLFATLSSMQGIFEQRSRSSREFPVVVCFHRHVRHVGQHHQCARGDAGGDAGGGGDYLCRSSGAYAGFAAAELHRFDDRDPGLPGASSLEHRAFCHDGSVAWQPECTCHGAGGPYCGAGGVSGFGNRHGRFGAARHSGRVGI
ncbi:MAG: MFS transporter [Cypionkella sp.]